MLQKIPLVYLQSSQKESSWYTCGILFYLMFSSLDYNCLTTALFPEVWPESNRPSNENTHLNPSTSNRDKEYPRLEPCCLTHSKRKKTEEFVMTTVRSQGLRMSHLKTLEFFKSTLHSFHLLCQSYLQKFIFYSVYHAQFIKKERNTHKPDLTTDTCSPSTW